jgi:hypothetical protein
VPPEVLAVVQAIKKWREANPNATAAEELDVLRQEWGKLYDLSHVDFMPHFDHLYPQAPGVETGRPWWKRPDWQPSVKLFRSAEGRWRFPTQSVTFGGNEGHKVDMVKSGGLLSFEERLRVYGQAIYGASNTSDQHRGSAAFVFLAPGGGRKDIAVHPDVYQRMSSYAFDRDHFGDINARKNYAPFDPKKIPGLSYELLIKNAVSLLDSWVAIEMSAKDRQKAIVWLHEHGIYEIRGVPVEDRIRESWTYDDVKELLEREEAWRQKVGFYERPVSPVEGQEQAVAS